ncbi:Uu.00g035810.m01.CDS01 [Anthostomella pinea]|uniref:Uu.00g035810.m01.CDS01 n=1 Tax=Anthostomella pinea TaxID=933095 RepID=A0AAI8V9E7_9PEZI|nr:Uu.00g035810.m01.CDS01 [Anthostomella pinea]
MSSVIETKTWTTQHGHGLLSFTREGGTLHTSVTPEVSTPGNIQDAIPPRDPLDAPRYMAIPEVIDLEMSDPEPPELPEQRGNENRHASRSDSDEEPLCRKRVEKRKAEAHTSIPIPPSKRAKPNSIVAEASTPPGGGPKEDSRGLRTLTKQDVEGKDHVFEFPPNAGLYWVTRCRLCPDKHFKVCPLTQMQNFKVHAQSSERHKNVVFDAQSVIDNDLVLVTGANLAWARKSNELLGWGLDPRKENPKGYQIPEYIARLLKARRCTLAKKKFRPLKPKPAVYDWRRQPADHRPQTQQPPSLPPSHSIDCTTFQTRQSHHSPPPEKHGPSTCAWLGTPWLGTPHSTASPLPVEQQKRPTDQSLPPFRDLRHGDTIHAPPVMAAPPSTRQQRTPSLEYGGSGSSLGPSPREETPRWSVPEPRSQPQAQPQPRHWGSGPTHTGWSVGAAPELKDAAETRRSASPGPWINIDADEDAVRKFEPPDSDE